MIPPARQTGGHMCRIGDLHMVPGGGLRYVADQCDDFRSSRMPRAPDTVTTDKALAGLDLNLLVVFEMIHSTGNVSEAARRLGTSQPNISNALGRMRDQLGDPLFVRSNRGVRPTWLANRLIGPVRLALSTLRDALQEEQHFDLAASDRIFRISMTSISVSVMLPTLLRKIREAGSSVRIEVVPPDTLSPQEGLLSGHLDVSINLFPFDQTGIEFEPMPPVEVVVIAARDHPRLQGSVTIEQFAAESHVVLPPETQQQLQVATMMLNAGVDRRIACVAPLGNDIPSIVGTTELIAMAPRRFAEFVAPRFGLQILKVPFEVPQLQLFLGWRAERRDDPGLSWLLSELRRLGRDPGARSAAS